MLSNVLEMLFVKSWFAAIDFEHCLFVDDADHEVIKLMLEVVLIIEDPVTTVLSQSLFVLKG